ncbi:transcriptional activator protein anr [Halomonas sp. GFAJ-1]|nr:helix-turn-helix domain-containing protein [Halomonas sp.]AVI61492.1 hypothetical protein BB497_01600 [Halomonas sp. GFAJ-1]EHK61861.1 transcriptional activator protein anr [Halomonas sp. GFAJ-1]MDP3536224.1 helix-turn-helix domain-containing protein [Halomonas sp.]
MYREGSAYVSCHVCSLRRTCLPGALSRQALETFDQLVERPMPYPDNHVITPQGAPFEALYMVRGGAVKQIQTSGLSHKPTVVDIYWPGDVVGLEWVGATYQDDALIAGSRSFVCKIPYGLLTVFSLKQQSVQKKLLQKTSHHLRQRKLRPSLMQNATACSKISAFLLTVAKQKHQQHYDPTHFTLPLMQAELASYLNLAPETVSRQLKALRQANIIDLQQRHVTIKDVNQLERWAE